MPSPAAGQAQESLAGETWQDLPRAHCSPSLFLWELPRAQWPHSQPLISGVLQRDWQQENVQRRPSWKAGQCLASALLDVCWGSSKAAAQRPRSGASSGDGRAAPITAGLSPCLLPQHRGHCPCPAPSPSQAPLQGQKKALSVKPRKSKDVNTPPESGDVGLFTNRVISVWSQAWRGTEAV